MMFRIVQHRPYQTAEQQQLDNSGKQTKQLQFIFQSRHLRQRFWRAGTKTKAPTGSNILNPGVAKAKDLVLLR